MTYNNKRKYNSTSKLFTSTETNLFEPCPKNSNNVRRNIINFSTSIDTDRNRNIIYCISIGKLDKLKELINNFNVNDIIDEDYYNMTALHYAVSTNYSDIVKYLINCGANPLLKNKDKKTCYDLAKKCNIKYLYNHLLEIKDNTINQLTDSIFVLQKDIESLKEKNTYLENSNNQYCNKIEIVTNKLETITSDLKKSNEQVVNIEAELSRVKRQRDESDCAFNNLLKKIKK